MEQRQTEVIERELRIEASPQTVYDFLTTPEKLVLWMGKVAEIDARPGGMFRLDYDGTNIARGEVKELDAGKRVVYSWGWETEGATTLPGTTLVEFTLLPDGDGTIVRMVHSGLGGDEIASHTEGWDYFLPRLSEAASGVAAVSST